MQTDLTKALKRGSAEVQDGKLTMAAGGTAKLSLKVPERQPLGSNEPVAELVIRGEDFETAAPLTHTDVQDLAKRLDAIASGEVWDGE